MIFYKFTDWNGNTVRFNSNCAVVFENLKTEFVIIVEGHEYIVDKDQFDRLLNVMTNDA